MRTHVPASVMSVQESRRRSSLAKYLVRIRATDGQRDLTKAVTPTCPKGPSIYYFHKISNYPLQFGQVYLTFLGSGTTQGKTVINFTLNVKIVFDFGMCAELRVKTTCFRQLVAYRYDIKFICQMTEAHFDDGFNTQNDVVSTCDQEIPHSSRELELNRSQFTYKDPPPDASGRHRNQWK